MFHPKRGFAWIWSGILCALLWVAGIPPAFAHASLLSTFPEDGAVLQEAPTQVRLVFNEPVRITQLQVLGSSGRALALENVVSTGNAPQGICPRRSQRGFTLSAGGPFLPILIR
jgi:Uncharacterized protein, homolog of Cu resistance protein CopC